MVRWYNATNGGTNPAVELQSRRATCEGNASVGFFDMFRRRIPTQEAEKEPVSRPPAPVPPPAQGMPDRIAESIAASKEWEDGETEQPAEGQAVAERTRTLVAQLNAARGEGRAQAFYAAIEEAYVPAPRPDRDALRRAIADDEQLDSLVATQLSTYSEQAAHAGAFVASLRASLLVYSLSYRYDSRDALMDLAELWRWAEEKGLDPMPHFRAIGRISSPEHTHLVGGSAKGMMRAVAIDADYRAELQC
jgi:hypothetical protein